MQTPSNVPFLVLLVSQLLLAGALPDSSQAQVVSGIITDQSSGKPVQGAMVILRDGESELHSGFLTDAKGRFLLRAMGSGEFTLQVERIGFTSLTTTPFPLHAGESQEIDLSLSPSPLDLDELVVKAEGQCLVRPEDGLEVARVWEEARKALLNQELTSRGGFLRYQVIRYRREQDLEGNPKGEERRRAIHLRGQTPILSLPASDLANEGYVRQSADGSYHFLGPDARVLLSDSFLDTHCFRLAEDRTKPGFIGVRFEPVQTRNIPDIEGTLWLDRTTALLKVLEYGYSRTPWAEAQGLAKGRVEFESLPNGAWVIRRWWIRMPIMVMDHTVRRLGGEGLRAGGIVEEGGEVTGVFLLEGGRIVDRVTNQTTPEGEGESH